MARQIKRSDISEEDVFKAVRDSANETLNTIKKLNEGLNNVATTLKGDIKNAKFGDASSIQKFTKAIQDANKAREQAIKLDKQQEQANQNLKTSEIQLEKIKQEKLKTEREEIRNAQLTAREKERQAKAAERAAKAARDESNEYKILEKETRKLKNESKELAAQLLKLESSGKKNTKAYRDLERQYIQVTKAAQKGDAQLKRIDRTVGDNFRNVGNYTGAVNKLRSGLMRLGGAFGLAFGGTQFVSFMKDSVAAFQTQEKAIAQVNAGLKSTGYNVGFTSEQLQQMASDLQKSTLFGDEQIMKDATAQLLTFTNITGEQFERTQKAALDLATRLDGDLKGASIQLGKALNDPIANLSALSRSGIQFSASQKEMIKTMVESGRLSEAQTLILDELNKQYGGSAEAAAKADGGLTQLSNAIGDAKEKFGKLIVEALRPTIQSLKTFFENLSEDDIRRFVSTLGTILSVLKSVVRIFIAYKLITSEAAKNLKRFTLSLWDSIKAMRAQGVSLNTLKSGFTRAGEGAKALGGALKSIGFAVAIELAIQFANALYEAWAASDLLTQQEAARAKMAEDAQQANTEGQRKGLEEISKLRKKLTDEAEEREIQFKEAIAKGELTEAEAAEFRAASIKQQNEEIARSYREYRNSVTQSLGDVSNTIIQDVNKGMKTADAFNKAIEEQRQVVERYVKWQTEGKRSKAQVAAEQAELKALREAKSALASFHTEAKELSRSLSIEQRDAAVEAKKAKKVTVKSIKQINTELKFRVDLTKELNDLLADQLKREQEIDKILRERVLSDLNEDLEEQIRYQTELMETTGEADITQITRILKEKTALQKEQINAVTDYEISELKRKNALRFQELRNQLELESQELLSQPGLKKDSKEYNAIIKQREEQRNNIDALEIQAENDLNEEIVKINLKRENELNDIDKELLKRKKDLNDELLAANEKYNAKLLEGDTKTKEDQLKKEQELAAQKKAIIEALTEYAIKKSDERIAQIEKEIEAAEQESDRLKELANQGNIEAQQSIAEQQRIIAEAERARQAELRRQERIKLASTVYTTYQGKVEDGSKQPLADTIRDVTLLQQFINSLPAFEEGTENTGKNGRGIDGKGGFQAILHPNERVMTSEQNNLVGDLSNNELAKIAQEYNAGKIVSKSEAAQQMGGAWSSAAVIKKLTEVQKAIESKPETNIQLESIIDGAMQISRKTKEKNTVIYNRYKIK